MQVPVVLHAVVASSDELDTVSSGWLRRTQLLTASTIVVVDAV